MVDKIIARRRSRGGLEYLVAWEGYDEFGDTWEDPGGLPPSEIAKFEAIRKPMPSSIELVLTTMRDKIARKLLPKSGPLFGINIELEIAQLPEYAAAVLEIFANPPRGPKYELSHPKHPTDTVTQLSISDMQTASFLVMLHDARPEHGVGALRISAGGAPNCDMLLVACTPTSPIVLTHRMPKGSTVDKPVVGNYKFTLEFSTVAIFGHNGFLQPYTAPDEELQLLASEEEELMVYAKSALKQTHSPKPIMHNLRAVWAHLPGGQWLEV